MADDDFTPSLPATIGLHRLIEEFGLNVPLPATRSEVVAGARRTVVSNGGVLEQYPKSYAPKGLFGNLRFALRYEPIALDVYGALFQKLEAPKLEEWIHSEPTSIFARRAWYLYELLMERKLPVDDLVPSGYIDLLDPKIHITGPRRLVRRQRINDNLLGSGRYSPLVRRTSTLRTFTEKDLAQRALAIVTSSDPAILARAVSYLYGKETKSSFAIEGEAPSKDRTARFVSALMKVSSFDATDKNSFVHLQNEIVDPRYAQRDWRSTQNFVSQTLPDFSEDVRFVPPKAEDVPELMNSWMEMVHRLEAAEKADPVITAAVVAFGFVFIHPFNDGNGRIHRFLVHHILAKLGFTPADILFPISATMLRHRVAYDQALERFSTSAMPFINYELDAQRGLNVSNDTARLYRYFDATPQAEYLYQCIEETIRSDLRDEIGFLSVFDAALRAVLDIVDMPNRRASLLIRLILQNKGRLSKGKRDSFSEINDSELAQIEQAVWTVWQDAHRDRDSEKA